MAQQFDLRSIQAQQAVQDASQQAMNSQRLQQAQQNLAQQAPGLLDADNYSKIAGLQMAAGDASGLREQVQAGLASQYDPGNQTVSPGVLAATNNILGAGTIPATASNDEAKQLSTLKQQRDLKNIMAQSMLQKAQIAADAKSNAGAGITAKEEQKASKDFTAPLLAQETKLDSSKADLQASLDTFNKNPNDMALGQLGISLAKSNLAGAGRLNAQELAPYRQFSAPSDMEKANNWLQGKVDPTMTDDQKKALTDLAGNVIDTYDTRKQKILGGIFSSQLPTYQKSLIQDGEVHPNVTAWANKLGLDVKPQADGSVQVAPKQAATTASTTDSNSLLGQAITKANKIKDPALRQNALKNLGKYSNETFNQDKASAFDAKMQQVEVQ